MVKKAKQQGFVSIIVASLVMVILGLITIGFTRVMQREQRQVLDRQLTRQALYAAESGINDVYAAIQSGALGAAEINTCDGSFSTIQEELDTTNGIEYSCILYDKTPSEVLAEVADSQSKLFELDNTGSDFSELTFEWGNKTASYNGNVADCSAGNVAVNNPASLTNNIPMIQLDLTRTDNYHRSNLIANSRYYYFVPCKGPGGSPVASINADTTTSDGRKYLVACNNGGNHPCRIRIDTSAFSSPRYLARIRPIYADANIRITGQSGSNPAEFSGVQTSIDVTARAADIVRRLRVAIPVEDVTGPGHVIQAYSGICKLLEINRASNTLVNGCGAYPPGAASGPGGTGDSAFTTSRCEVNPTATGCTRGGGSSNVSRDTVYWGANFYNTANNPDNIVDSCTWDFGDGTTRGGPATDPANACLYGQRIFNYYGPPTSPIDCTTYTVVLTIRFNNSYADRDYVDRRVMPSGPGSNC